MSESASISAHTLSLVREKIRVAIAEGGDERNPIEVLLDLREEILAYERAGRPMIGLWNILRSTGAIHCGYGRFTGVMKQFRERFGLPAPRKRIARKLDAATSSGRSPRGEKEAVYEGLTEPPKAPSRRSTQNDGSEGMAKLPAGSKSALFDLARERMEQAAPGGVGGAVGQ